MTTTAISPAPAPAASAPPHRPGQPPRLGRVLRAQIAKEMRQNLVFLGLAISLVVVIACLVEYLGTGFLAYNYRTLNVLLYPSLATSIPLACAVAGLTLGIAQPLADVNADRWAFLIHRPVPRSMLFWGRALAGLTVCTSSRRAFLWPSCLFTA